MSAARSSGGPACTPAEVAFGGLRVRVPHGLLQPRPWTLLQSDWAVELLADSPDGPVVELCSGAGHIGLDVARRTGRRTILVDADERACDAARSNAVYNGLAAQVEVRHAELDIALQPAERPALVLADPPYVATSRVWEFPDDPRHAIDGGLDGLALVRRAVRTSSGFPAAPLLLQLQGRRQADALALWLQGRRGAISELREVDPERAVALIRWQPGAPIRRSPKGLLANLEA